MNLFRLQVCSQCSLVCIWSGTRVLSVHEILCRIDEFVSFAKIKFGQIELWDLLIADIDLSGSRIIIAQDKRERKSYKEVFRFAQNFT